MKEEIKQLQNYVGHAILKQWKRILSLVKILRTITPALEELNIAD